MIHVETVDLSTRGIAIPRGRVGMVVAQPKLSLTAAEPYQCRPVAKTDQLEFIARTLTIACAAPHGARKTHFTIFPEFSILGLEGVALIETKLRTEGWHSGTVVIGGVDGLTQADYIVLVNSPDTFPAWSFFPRAMNDFSSLRAKNSGI